MSTAERVIGVIRDYTEDDPTPSYSLFDDMDMDNLDVIEIVMDLEDEFGIDIEDAAFAKWKTVQDVISCIEGMVA